MASEIYWVIITSIDVMAVFFNTFLIYLALFKTPKPIKLYTTLIINMAITDVLTVLSSIFIQPRIIPSGFTHAYVLNGVCKYFGHSVCFYGVSFNFHLLSHSTYSLFLSFAYRYYILVRPEPKRNSIIIVIFLFYIISFIQMILYDFAESDPAVVTAKLQAAFPNYNLTGLTITGREDFRDPRAMFKYLNLTVLAIPFFVAIVILRKKIIAKLNIGGADLTATTKTAHMQLLMALTYQALIPSIYIISLTMFLLEECGIYEAQWMEDYMFSALTLIPFASPLSSFIFFTPYRRFILQTLFRKKDKIGPISITSGTA